MPSKYQLINEMANNTLHEITKDGSNWIEFLNTASNNYKYSFNEQVLIYAQKPNATACADIETWREKKESQEAQAKYNTYLYYRKMYPEDEDL